MSKDKTYRNGSALMERYKLVIIGSGPAGKAAAEAAARFGIKSALIDNRVQDQGLYGYNAIRLFMNCVRKIYDAKEVLEFGLNISGEIDFNAIREHVIYSSKIINSKRVHDEAFGELVDTYNAQGSFISKNEVSLSTGEILYGEKIIIATGSLPGIPAVKGLEETQYYNEENFLAFDEIPRSLLIIGEGNSAVELAQGFTRLGSKVTVVSEKKRILASEDREISDTMQEVLRGEGVRFLLGCSEIEISEDKTKKRLMLNLNNELIKLEFDKIIIADERKPNTAKLGLEKIGLKTQSGKITVDQYLATSIPNIYAIGDVKGVHPLPHKGIYEAQVAISNAVFELKRKVRYDNLPSVVYTEPQVYRVGFDEDLARDGFNNVSVYRYKLKESSSIEFDKSNNTGMIKIITDNKKRIIGAHAIGENAEDFMQELVYAITFGHKLQNISKVIHPYLSRSESVRECADQFWKQNKNSEDAMGFTKFYNKLFKRR